MVTVIIVTTNCQGVIKECLSSVLKNKADFEIIVIDNASSDKTLRIINDKFPKVRVIKNKKNVGFAAAVNQGLSLSKGDALLLNPDTLCKKNLIITLEGISKRKNVGAVSCQILNPDRTLQPSCGNFPTALNLFLDKVAIIRRQFPISELIRTRSYYKKEQSPDWVSGVCFYITSDARKIIGNLDVKYFAYVEEVDWCYRARQNDFKVIYTPQTSLIHLDEGRSPEKSPFKYFHMRRGFSTFFKKHKKGNDLLWFKFLLRLEILVKELFGNKTEKWKMAYKKTKTLL